MNSISDKNKINNANKTIIVHLKNSFGVLENILNVFSERLIPLVSVNSILLENEDVYKIVIIAKLKDRELIKIIQFIKKKVFVIKVESYNENEIIYYELGFFKISYDYYLNNEITEHIINKHNASIFEINKEFIFLEKKGSTENILIFLEEIKPHGLVKFNRSGKILINKY
jgi:acetolactate synthase I/III small subunit